MKRSAATAARNTLTPVALGEADETWPQIVNDAARGKLKDIYSPVDETGKERKPSLKQYPVIPWQSIDLEQFNLVLIRVPAAQEVGEAGELCIIPVESGRGCLTAASLHRNRILRDSTASH